MAVSLTNVLVRRAQLAARIEHQRNEVRRAITGLAGPIAVIDRALVAGRYLRSHPIAVGGIVALLVALRTRSLLRVIIRGAAAWRLIRRARTLLARFGI